jgi:hypothetical protein
MSLDQPATSAALWQIFAATGARPEFVLPVLSYESGLNPAALNSLGYAGLNQINRAFLTARNIDVNDYVTWPASRQLTTVVGPYLEQEAKYAGKSLSSGVLVYEANFWPASLKTDPSMSTVVVASPAAGYTANEVFDTQKKGYITKGDLAHAVASQVPHPAVQAAIAAAYANAPAGVGPMQDPVYGGGGLTLTRSQWLAVAVMAGVGAAFVYTQLYGVPRPIRRLLLAT